MRSFYYTVLLGLVALAFGCSSAPKKPDAPKAYKLTEPRRGPAGDPATWFARAKDPVATIDGKPVGARHVNFAIDQANRYFKSSCIPKTQAERMVDRAKKMAVHQHIVDELIKTEKIVVTQKQVDAEWAKLMKRFPDKDAREAWFKYLNRTEAQYRDTIARALLQKALFKKLYKINITEQDAKKYYDENRKRYDRPARIKARHILFKTSKDPATNAAARAKAEEVLKLAKAPGANFAELAKKHSQGPSSRSGGDLGVFGRRAMVKPFSDAAFKMKEGEVSGIVQTRFGFHIINVYKVFPAGLMPFKDVRDRIESALFMKAYRKHYPEFLKRQLEMDIKFIDENITLNQSRICKPKPAPTSQPASTPTTQPAP